MAVEVVYCLAAVGFAVNDKPCAFFRTATTLGDFLRFEEQPPQQARIPGIHFHHVADMLFRNYQYMHRRLGVHVVKGKDFLVFVYLFCGYFPAYNSTENAVAHALSIPQILKL